MNNGVGEIVNSMKILVDNYANNRKLSAVMFGIYDGESIVVNEKLAIPMELTKNMLGGLMVGDKVKVLRNDGGQEFYIMEVVGKNTANRQSESEGG